MLFWLPLGAFQLLSLPVPVLLGYKETEALWQVPDSAPTLMPSPNPLPL